MSHPTRTRPAGFHHGELAVQQRAGVAEAAARLSGMLAPAELRGGLARFLADRTFAALTARDRAGRLWISPLTVRLNGTLTAADDDTLRIDVDQAYGNCPQYIQQRTLAPGAAVGQAPAPVRRGSALTRNDANLMRAADTFLIGSTHPTRGSDASHRGGPPGFVRVKDGRLWWPDYPGNNMFNTLGNLVVDPAVALLFCDFATGRTLHLSGTAAADWTTPGIGGDDGGTGRRVRFSPHALVAGHLLPLRASAVTGAADNPALTGQFPARRQSTHGRTAPS